MNNKGFTLIEVIIVIGIIGVLATMALIGMNPSSYFQSARNNQREIHVNTIHGALIDYISKEGEYPPCVPDTGEVDATDCESHILNGNIPVDPLGDDCAIDQSGYLIKKSTDYTIGVKANCAEGDEDITAGEWNE